MLSRRDVIRLGLLGGAIGLLRPRLARADALPASPPTTPFLADLPLPPSPQPVPPFIESLSADCLPYVGSATKYYQLVEEARQVSFHPELPPTRVWSYRDITVPPGAFPFAVGPTFKETIGQGAGGGVVVRHFNDLPVGPIGFGDPRTSVHHHGGHNPSHSDGFPTAFFGPGESFDYCYPLRDPGFSTGSPDPTERTSTTWYHDHMVDFTGPNVYRGLAGFFLAFDEVDAGDETLDDGTNLRLPSGDFDIPLALQDRRFARDGSLVFDPTDQDGFLGDKFAVNGAIQPKFRVKRRKYRFRFLDGSNARYYQVVLADGTGRTFPFDQIATEGGLLAAPLRNLRTFRLAPAERVEIVVDFRQIPQGVSAVYLENRQQQDDGRKPGKVLARGPQLLQFILEEEVEDPSRVPDILRPFSAISAEELASAKVRTLEFERTDGAWAINGEFFDPDRPLVTSPMDGPEIWKIKNSSGGWAHPIHVHLELARVLRRNGKLPPLQERDGFARRDLVDLGPGENADLFFRFRDFPGRYVFHCHNVEHEDLVMMARFDVV